jgi:hypothetical protein
MDRLSLDVTELRLCVVHAHHVRVLLEHKILGPIVDDFNQFKNFAGSASRGLSAFGLRRKQLIVISTWLAEECGQQTTP